MSVFKLLTFLLCVAPLFPQNTDSGQGSPSTGDSGYAGPSILSRGIGPRFSSATLARFRPYIGVNGVYSNGLNSVSVDSHGKVVSGDSEGVELSYGVSGTHSWSHGSSVSLNYHGDFRHYTRLSYNDGTSQNLDLRLQHQLARHVLFDVGVSAGTYSGRFGYVGAIGYYDPVITQQSTRDLFDNRTLFLQTTGRLIYQKSARLSFGFGGGGFLTRRRSTSLFGSTGYMATADVTYRLTKAVSIGADYGYLHYDFLRVFGSTNVHTEAVDLSFRLSKQWEAGIRGGVFRAENLLLQTVRIDPAIAAITGQSNAVIASYNVVYSPMFNVRLSRSFRQGSCGVSYARGTTPGNGVFLASRADNVGLACSYTAQHRWNFGFGSSYNTLSALQQSISTYRYVEAHVGVTRSLTRGLGFQANSSLLNNLTKYPGIGARRYFVASIGFTYSPGDLPLSLW